MANSVTRIAEQDIRKEIIYTQYKDEYFDVWNVTLTQIFSKEQKRLNRELGIHKVNK